MSKYVNPTGDGYIATYSSEKSASLSTSVLEMTSWEIGDQVAVIAEGDALRILSTEKVRDPDGVITTITVRADGNIISLSPNALSCINALGEDSLIRVYDRPTDGLTVVPVDRDPFVEEGDQ